MPVHIFILFGQFGDILVMKNEIRISSHSRYQYKTPVVNMDIRIRTHAYARLCDYFTDPVVLSVLLDFYMLCTVVLGIWIKGLVVWLMMCDCSCT
jgi:hypothetical protein